MWRLQFEHGGRSFVPLNVFLGLGRGIEFVVHHLYDRGILDEEVVDVIVINDISTRSRGSSCLTGIPHRVLDYPGDSRAHNLVRRVSQSFLLIAGSVQQSFLNPLKIKVGEAFYVDLLP